MPAYETVYQGSGSSTLRGLFGYFRSSFIASIAALLVFFLSSRALRAEEDTSSSVYPNRNATGGIYDLVGAFPYPKGTFGVQARGSLFFMNGFIGDLDTTITDNGDIIQTKAGLGAFYVPWSPLEVGIDGEFSYAQNDYSTGDRDVVRSFENIDLNFRLVHALPRPGTPFLYGGLYGHVRFFSGSYPAYNNQYNRAGTLYAPIGGATIGLDFRAFNANVPLRLTTNVGFRMKNSAAGYATANQNFKRYAMQLYENNALTYGMGMEYLSRYVIIKGEYSAVRAFNGSLALFAQPQHATVGVLIRPVEALGIDVGCDIGITRKQRAVVPATADWTMLTALSYTFLGARTSTTYASGASRLYGKIVDKETKRPIEGVTLSLMGSLITPISSDSSGKFDFGPVGYGNYNLIAEKTGYESATIPIQIVAGEEKTVEIVMQKPGPVAGKIRGRVIDDTTNQPIANAAIAFPGTSQQSIASEAETGTFLTPDFPEQEIRIHVEKQGYKPFDGTVNIIGGETIDHEIRLVPDVEPTGKLEGTVTNEKGVPLTTVFTFKDSSLGKPFATNPLSGTFSEALKPGFYEITATAENYLPQDLMLEIRAGQTQTLNIVLKKPKEAIVIKDRIIISDSIYFKFNSAILMAQSNGILNQIVRILSKKRRAQLRIEGHTDGIGSQNYNQRLSKQRSNAVRGYLIRHGIAADRVTAIGFGKSRPIATNDTPEGRAENRRVEFHLVTDPPAQKAAPQEQAPPPQELAPQEPPQQEPAQDAAPLDTAPENP